MKYDKTLKGITKEILSSGGALIEEKDGCLEVLLPERAAGVLEIPEYSKLSFSAGGADTLQVSYETDFFNRLAGFFPAKTGFCEAGFPFQEFGREKVEKLLPESVSFSNATFRLEKIETEDFSYFLFIIKYTALSDEKREGVLPVLVNGLTGSAVRADENLLDELEEAPPGESGGCGDIAHFMRPAFLFAEKAVGDILRELAGSLKRRLNRDAERIHRYYGTLREELLDKIKKKIISESRGEYTGPEGDIIDPSGFLEKIEKRELKCPGTEKLYAKLQAVEKEKNWKIQDVLGKYSLTVKLEPVVAVRINVRAPVARIIIKRKLSSRPFPVTFNPFFRKLDELPCESCFVLRAPYYVCDDGQHILCRECFGDCPGCGKPFCRACGAGCTRCGRTGKSGKKAHPGGPGNRPRRRPVSTGD